MTKLCETPDNDNASRSPAELDVMTSGADMGALAVQSLKNIRPHPQTRQDAWLAVTHWFDRRKWEAETRPSPRDHREALRVRALLKNGLYDAFRAGYRAGASFTLHASEEFGHEKLLDAEAEALGIARGQSMVYDRKWPRTMSPADVASVALQEALQEGHTPKATAGQIAAMAGLLGAYGRGVMAGVVQGATTYFKHSGRGHLRIVRAPVAAGADRRRRPAKLRVVSNPEASPRWAAGTVLPQAQHRPMAAWVVRQLDQLLPDFEWSEANVRFTADGWVRRGNPRWLARSSGDRPVVVQSWDQPQRRSGGLSIVTGCVQTASPLLDGETWGTFQVAVTKAATVRQNYATREGAKETWYYAREQMH